MAKKVKKKDEKDEVGASFLARQRKNPTGRHCGSPTIRDNLNQQGIAFVVEPTEEEIDEAVSEVSEVCKSLLGLTRREVRFAVVYTLCDPNSTFKHVARMVGFGLTAAQAADMRSKPHVREACVEVARQLCDKSSQRVIVGVAKLADKLAQQLMNGEIESLDKGQQYIVELALRRSGMSLTKVQLKKAEADAKKKGLGTTVVSDPENPTEKKNLSDVMAGLSGKMKPKTKA